MKKKILLLVTAIILLLAVVVTYYVTSKPEEVYSKINPLGEEESIIFLGDEDADNEIILAFDYSCPHCHNWIKEVFPVVNQWIEDGTVKFRTQSMVYLNENSLKLSKLDQNIKKYHPESYYDVFFQLMNDSDEANWATDEYISALLEKNQLNNEEIIVEPSLDVIQITRAYTKELNIEYVPTIFVNGKKVEDPFSTDQIKDFLK